MLNQNYEFAKIHRLNSELLKSIGSIEFDGKKSMSGPADNLSSIESRECQQIAFITWIT